jgi:hypothetical protein
VGLTGANGGAMASIIPFINNRVFEPSDIKLMSDAYGRAMEGVSSFGHPNKFVAEFIAARIITLTSDGERDPGRLCERAVAACGFKPVKQGREGA